jgi:hypothetical protein
MVNTILSVIGKWRELVAALFGDYPLAAALLTLAALGLFFHLQKTMRRGRTATNALIALLAWAVAVPILGTVLTILSKAWEFVEAVVPALARVSGSLYGIYSRHPILVAVLVLLAVVAYFVWGRWWPRFWPNRTLRIAALVAGVILAAHIASPIADLFTPTESARPAGEKAPNEKSASPAPAGTGPVPANSGSAVK